MPDANAVSDYLQDRLKRERLCEVAAVQAALWLHQAGLLRDSTSSPGLPLRNLLRASRIRGQHQEPNGRWYIRVCDREQQEPTSRTQLARPEMPVQQVETDHLHVLPDYLRDGLDIVFVGTAASDVSAARKHYYSGYNNAFYKCIFQAGIAPVPLGPEDDWRLPDYGIGLTDMVKNSHAGDDSNLSRSELFGGAPSLEKKMTIFSPRIVCFNGRTAYAAYAGRGWHHYGLAEMTIGASKVFVVPSTSGRVNAGFLLDGKTRLQWFETLVRLRDAQPLPD